jgi:bifunctional ADP-heptose synthase (sugar kinase/adenylyltransferase)
MNFLVIGEKCKDVFVYGEVTRLSPEAPVPVFKPTRKVENLGMAANVYNNLFNLIEHKASVVGHFSTENIIKTRYVDDKSNHYFIRVDENDTADRIKISPHLIKIIHNSDCIILSDYDKGFLSANDIYLICQEKKDGAIIFLDTKKKLKPAILDQVDFVKFNESEYNLNINTSEQFTKKIIVTKGGEGAYYDGQDFPSEKKLTIDVSGAGDTFLAALAFYFMTSQDIKKAIQEANKSACKVVSERGVSVI